MKRNRLHILPAFWQLKEASARPSGLCSSVREGFVGGVVRVGFPGLAPVPDGRGANQSPRRFSSPGAPGPIGTPSAGLSIFGLRPRRARCCFTRPGYSSWPGLTRRGRAAAWPRASGGRPCWHSTGPVPGRVAPDEPIRRPGRSRPGCANYSMGYRLRRRLCGRWPLPDKPPPARQRAEA